MKVTLSEIKKNVQGNHSGEDEAENQINDLGHKDEKTFNQDREEEKRIQKMRIAEGDSGTISNVPTFES